MCHCRKRGGSYDQQRKNKELSYHYRKWVNAELNQHFPSKNWTHCKEGGNYSFDNIDKNPNRVYNLVNS